MGWSTDEEPVFVLEDGTVLLYSLFGSFKTSFSMGQEAKDMKILNARYVNIIYTDRYLKELNVYAKVILKF